MKHRLFVALPISENLQRVIVQWTQDNIALPVRLVAAKNLHITLVPPWEIDATESAKSALETLAGKGSFVLNFTHVTFGPNLNEPRLIWAAGETTVDLLDLKKRAEQAFREPSQNRPYRLHLTLARFRAQDFRAFPVKSLDKRVAWQTTVLSVQLMESHLLPAGAEYDVLAQVIL